MENQAIFLKPKMEHGVASTSTVKPDEREFIVASCASVQVMSKNSVSPEELDTVKASRLSVTAITSNGSTHTTEEAVVYVNDLDMFVTVPLLEVTPTVLYLDTLRRTWGVHTSGKKTKIQISSRLARLHFANKINNFVPIVVLGRSREAHIASSAEDSAAHTKELTPDEEDTTQALGDRLEVRGINRKFGGTKINIFWE